MKNKPYIIFDFYKTLYCPKRKCLYRGTRSLLKRLSTKNKLILITSGGLSRKRLIKKIGITCFFAKIFIVKQKNLNTFSQLAPNSETTTIIGDRLDSEISFGNILGYKTIPVNPDKENPVLTIKEKLKVI